MKRQLLRSALLAFLVAPLVSGCGIQDSTQPRENSISAGPKTDGALVKAKKGVRPATPPGKAR